MQWLFVGLGNPGPEYSPTRHNAGQMALDAIADGAKIGLSQNKPWGRYGEGRLAGSIVGLMKPATYMNLSGEALSKCLGAHPVDLERIVVFHDDMDLETGRLQLKIGGGDGGHRGLRSITEHLGAGFTRVRMGVGRPAEGVDPVEYVLERFGSCEQQAVDAMLKKAVEAARIIASGGMTRAMNAINKRSNPCSAQEAGPDRPKGGAK
jgi:PTH1 family peptidyl-tRNA hydrolase